MEINILGPLDVVVNDSRVTPSAPKPRRVLTLLAVNANHVVRNEQLIEEVWEDRPPISVATTLQTYVYQLRKSLRLSASSNRVSEPGMSLTTFAGGYMLSLDRTALDALRFERLARLGREQVTAGDVATGAQTLTEALRLWRGPAMVDINPGPILTAEALRLEEVRKSTLELRLEADLELGRHHELLGELIHLVTAHPTHEGFRAKLMVALYRAGRRSEALHSYQQTRGYFIDELGIDPSQYLQRLHQDILEGTSPLTVPATVRHSHAS
jgi:DNA-binding SARP family transcriptional activator